MIPKMKTYNFTASTLQGTMVHGTVNAPTKLLAKLNVIHYSGYSLGRPIKIGGVRRKYCENPFTITSKAP